MHEYVNPFVPAAPKTAHGYFGDIFLTEAIFRKYLKENY